MKRYNEGVRDEKKTVFGLESRRFERSCSYELRAKSSKEELQGETHRGSRLTCARDLVQVLGRE